MNGESWSVYHQTADTSMWTRASVLVLSSEATINWTAAVA